MMDPERPGAGPRTRCFTPHGASRTRALAHPCLPQPQARTGPHYGAALGTAGLLGYTPGRARLILTPRGAMPR